MIYEFFECPTNIPRGLPALNMVLEGWRGGGGGGGKGGMNQGFNFLCHSHYNNPFD